MERSTLLTLAYVVPALLLLLLLGNWISGYRVREIPYAEFKQHLREGKVAEVVVGEARIEGEVRPGGEEEPYRFVTVRPGEDPELIPLLEKQNVTYTGEAPSDWGWVFWLLFPLALLALMWGVFLRQFSRAGQNVMSFGRSRAKMVSETDDTHVTFDDVAGAEEAKVEMREIVEFLRDPAKFERLGGRMPKGVLLVGPPGTGKTLMARAVAGGARVPFFLLSGSDFVEMFVGVGASRVRDLFRQAKDRAPCIVFIDELDAIGRHRGTGLGGGHDEREQTLNALLVEMDGFESTGGVIIMAATNRPDVLDPALLRPGRFDRQIVIDAPDVVGREAVLRVHGRGKPLAADANLTVIAKSTPGFSGADLANVVNEAALLAARRGADRIFQADLEEAVERVLAGPERRSRRLTEDEKRRVAYHEVGHALVAVGCEHADPVHKISIVPRGQAALGYTVQLPAEDRYLMTRAELADRITGLLGGRAAEQIVFGEVSTGAGNDLERATDIAQSMVRRYGMSDRLGPLAYGRDQSPVFLGREIMEHRKDYSEKTAEEIDSEVRRIVDESFRRAMEILQRDRPVLDRITARLLVRETIDVEELRRLLGAPRSPRPTSPPSAMCPTRRCGPDPVRTRADAAPGPAAYDPPVAPAGFRRRGSGGDPPETAAMSSNSPVVVRPAAERGRTDLGWLDSRHTFSFGEYLDRRHMGFRTLRVINDDRVAGGGGFPTHGHRDMEILSWVLAGRLEHRDSLGYGEVLRPGDLQHMTAGTGVMHSEFNPSPDEPVHFLQVWILPRRRGLAPAYGQKHFPVEQRRNRLVLVAAGDGRDGSALIEADADVWTGVLDRGAAVAHELRPGRAMWLQVASGAVTLDGRALDTGDGAAIEQPGTLEIRGASDGPAEVMVFDLA